MNGGDPPDPFLTPGRVEALETGRLLWAQLVGMKLEDVNHALTALDDDDLRAIVVAKLVEHYGQPL